MFSTRIEVKALLRATGVYYCVAERNYKRQQILQELHDKLFLLNADLWYISKRCWFQMFDLQLCGQKGDPLRRTKISPRRLMWPKITQKSYNR